MADYADKIGFWNICRWQSNNVDFVVIMHLLWLWQVLDTSERDHALAELGREREIRRSAELEAAKARLTHELLMNECNELRHELQRQRQQLTLLRSVRQSVDRLLSGFAQFLLRTFICISLYRQRNSIIQSYKTSTNQKARHKNIYTKHS